MKILVSCIQYPPKGGASVLAYHTVKLLRKLGGGVSGSGGGGRNEVKCLFINPSNVKYNPDGLGGVYLLLASTKVLPKDEDMEHVKKDIGWDKPDIVLAYHHYAPTVSKLLYPDSKIIYITATCTPYNRYFLSKGVDYNQAMKLDDKSIRSIKKTHYRKLEMGDIRSSFLTICNSRLTKNLFNKFYYEKDLLVKVDKRIFDSSGILAKNYSHMAVNKIYDIILIASDFKRPAKNSEFVFDLLSKMPEIKKCIIGKNANEYCKLENCDYRGFIGYDAVQKCLQQSKILLTPSLYESGGNVAREALNNGCSVLLSDCCAFFENYSEKYICHEFSTEEWSSKINAILDDYKNQLTLYDLLKL